MKPLYGNVQFVNQIWCAAGVNLQGGRTRDGGSIVGASVFYTNSRLEGEEKGEGEMPEKTTCTEVEKLDKELKVLKLISSDFFFLRSPPPSPEVPQA